MSAAVRPQRDSGQGIASSRYALLAMTVCDRIDCHCERSEAISLTMMHQYYVYILSNRHNTVLYVGVTSDLARRVYEHREKLIDDFTKRYNVNKLVYYEVTNDVAGAIFREKQLKTGSRQKKVDLITATNPTWEDLYDQL